MDPTGLNVGFGIRRAPEGNGCVERFIRTRKENLLWVRRFDTIEELRVALHRFQEIYKVIAAAGAELLYLPPYNPDLNPIEHAFVKLKTLLRSAAARTVDVLWRTLGQLLDAFGPTACTNYLAHAGYVPSNREMLSLWPRRRRSRRASVAPLRNDQTIARGQVVAGRDPGAAARSPGLHARTSPLARRAHAARAVSAGHAYPQVPTPWSLSLLALLFLNMSSGAFDRKGPVLCACAPPEKIWARPGRVRGPSLSC